MVLPESDCVGTCVVAELAVLLQEVVKCVCLWVTVHVYSVVIALNVTVCMP